MIEKLYELMTKIGITRNQDKVLHFMAGFMIAISFTLVFAPIYGVVAGVVAGLGKEAWDQYQYDGADFFDFFVTISGTWTGVMLLGLFGI